MSRVVLPVATLCLAGAISCMAGCNLVGPAVYFIHGPPRVKPQYQLPDDRPTVVFLDDRGSIMPSRAVRQRASKAAEHALLEGKAVSKSEIISSDALMPIATQERFGKPSGIAQIGEKVKAEVVVYATIDSFGLTPDGHEFAPTASARVKVIDVKTRQRLWPADETEWAPVQAMIPTKTGAPPTTLTERTLAEQQLADTLGRNIGRLFVEYVSEEVSQRVGDRTERMNMQ